MMLKRLLTFVVSACLLAPAAAGADPISDCLDASSRGDKAAVKRSVETILLRNTPLLPDQVEAGERCLRAATGKNYTYSGARAQFLSADDLEREASQREKAAAEAAERTDEQRAGEARVAAEVKRQMEAAERTRREEAEVAERRRKLEQAIADVEAERKAQVMEKLSEACRALYRRDEHAAVLNNRCFGLFLVTGLPID